MDESGASIFGFTPTGTLLTPVPVLPFHVSLIVILHTAYSSTLKKEATGSSETLLNAYQTTWLHDPATAVTTTNHHNTYIHTYNYVSSTWAPFRSQKNWADDVLLIKHYAIKAYGGVDV
jgi:hypothetical protein